LIVSLDGPQLPVRECIDGAFQNKKLSARGGGLEIKTLL
jgi:hypothetical protein